MYAASGIGSRDSSCKRCKQKQRKQASHQKQTRKQLAINQPHWRPGSDAAQSHRVYHGASGAVSEAEFHNISKEGGTSHAPGDGELNDGAAYDMWSRSPQKTRSDLLSLWWDSSALPGLEPQDRTTTSRRGQAQPLAGDRCATTLATRVDDGSHVGGFCVREKFFGDSPNPTYGHI